MDKSCIIFACTILSPDRLFVLQEFLNSFEIYFKDVDIYVGINTGTLPEAIDLINSSQLNIQSINYGREELYTQSDASAFQVALHSLNLSNKEYSNYWFVHTKGAINSHSDYLRKWYLDNFISDRHNVEKYIEEHGVGSYGKLGLNFQYDQTYGETDTEIPLFENTITEQLPYTHASFFYIHTLYVITHKPMNKFLKLITNKWFTSKLDRYYFEGIFPFIVSRTGYYPYIENRIDCSNQDLKPPMERWLIHNKLKHNLKYKTDFHFNQLNPPYANSNA